MAARPIRLAVALGDPTGIGPEVLARALAALAHAERDAPVHLLLVGDEQTWRAGQEAAGVDLPVRPADAPAPLAADGVPFLAVAAGRRDWQPGAVHPQAGRAAATWLEHAVRLALAGRADAVVFAPLNKEAIMRAGYPVRDEYELCAALAGSSDHDEVNVIPHPAFPEASGRLLWVARVTGHVPFREVAGRLTAERILRTIRLGHRIAAAVTPRPRIGVAALNPHAGEGGLLGREEIEVIGAAIAAATGEGIDASGPHPADHIFRRARAGEFDAVVAMYHDQAQIATKLLGFDRGVSVGVGYPFVLATPSHGTAFDIVGTGRADPGPMLQALRIALRLAAVRDRADAV